LKDNFFMKADTPDRAAALRLFIALWPHVETRNALAAWQQAWMWPGKASLVPPERLHLTLHFLGDVPVHRMAELVAALRVPFAHFSLPFGTGEIWPGGTAVALPAHVPPLLEALHANLAAALRALDLSPESRPYRPHVTLARRAVGAIPAPQPLPCDWRVNDGYVLVRSLPGGRGYEILARFS